MADVIQQFLQQQQQRPGLLPTIGSGLLGIQQATQARQAREAQAQRLAEYQNTLGQFMDTKNPELLPKLYDLAPEGKYQAVQAAWQDMDEMQRKSKLQQDMNVIAPLTAGNDEMAISTLNEMAAAAENSGDPEEAKMLRGFSDQITQGNGDMVLSVFSLQSGITPEGQEAMKNLYEFQKDRRAQNVEQANVLKWANDLELTGDERAKSIELAMMFGDDMAKKILEYSGTKKDGVVDPAELADFTTTLRKEYTRDAAGFRAADQNKQKMDSSLASGTSQGDIAAITTFMKMLDEGSVVREGEFRTASQTGGAIDMLKNIIGGWRTGQRLTDDQRADFQDLTDAFYKIAEEKGAEIDTRMENVLDYHNIPKDQVMFVSEEVTPDAGAVVTTESGLTYTPVAADELSQAQAFARSRNPNSTGRIEEMTMEELQAAYPGTMGAFQPQTAIGTEAVEVDY